jgi:hypothetical protein
MCEPRMLTKTGLTVRDHQEHTVENFVRLCQLWDGSQALYRPCDQRSCPFMPVLQGWTLADYFLRTSTAGRASRAERRRDAMP